MWIDLLFFAVAAIGFYWGYARGIIRTVSSVAAVFVGLFVAMRFGPDITRALARATDQPVEGALPLFGFLIAFVGVLIALRIAASLVERILTRLHLNFLNRVAGGMASAVIAIFFYSVLVLFTASAGLVSEHVREQSATYSALAELPERVYKVAGGVVGQ